MVDSLEAREVQVSDYYFNDYYRVVVVNEGDRFTVSVDVYRRGWLFSGHEEKCVSNNKVCLLFKPLDPSTLPGELSSIIDQVIVIGARVSGVEETISVKWVLKKEPGYSEVSRIYECSWRIVGCEPPSQDSFHIRCS